MAKFELRLIEVINETHDTKTFRFSLENARMDLLPGHFIMINKMLDGKLVRRAYSISSSPLEKRFIDLTIKRVENGVFSNYMFDNAQAGDIFGIDGPYGKFVYKDSDDDVLLLGAGCGAAPLRAILKYILEKKLDINVILLHSCRTPDDLLFRDELLKLEKENKNFRYAATLTRVKGDEWKGCIGWISREMVEENVKNKDNTLFFVSGHVKFGNAMMEVLDELGVDKGKVKEEVF